jgi:type IV pilus assembly protein PilY1
MIILEFCRYQKIMWVVGMTAVGAIIGPSSAAPLDLADVPLFLTVSVPPNVVATLDTSGSMNAAHTPGSPDGGSGTRRYKSAAFNPMYYNPAVRYLAPFQFDGSIASTPFAAAHINGFDPAKGSVNLSNGFRPTSSYSLADTSQNFADHYASKFDATDFRCASNICQYNDSGTWTPFPGSPSCSGTDTNDCKDKPMPAYYYVFDAGNAGCDGTKTDDDCYTLKIVGATSGPGTIDLNGDGAIDAADTDERQNFANWYSFYRTRILALVSAADLAFWEMPGSVRVAWQNLNTCNDFNGSNCPGRSGTNYPNHIREFSGTHRDTFFKWLFDIQSASGTPLRIATQRVGKYYQTSTGTNNPYAEFPQSSVGTVYSCRRNYHILMTDGEWNETGESGLGNYDNEDGSDKTLPDGKAYSGSRKPYTDDNSGSLADVIFHFWSTDLRTDLTNNVPAHFVEQNDDPDARYWNAKNDPATWQHMVTFTVGLGLTSQLAGSETLPIWGGSTYAGDYSALVAGSKAWPTAGTNGYNRVYDLWHGALNSRGQFFSAEEPGALTQAFRNIINAIAVENPSATALATNSGSIQESTRVYQARFDPASWLGQLLALPVRTDGTVGDALWDAATKMPAAASRKVFTWDGGSGQTFTSCANLGASQKAELDKNASGIVDNQCADRLTWLRGDHDKEQRNGGAYRNRLGKIQDLADSDGDGDRAERIPIEWSLGDIINSDPVYVKTGDFGYGTPVSGLTTAEKGSYGDFVNGKSSRIPVVYAGANDGMLHAFHADTGVESFAYVPAGVYATLSKLTAPDYAHRFYVDGPPNAGDAFLAGAWKTVLVGGLGAGGKSVYALDISNPGGFGAGNVLWDFSDAADLGLTFSQPQIARLADGKWYAIFGNGYNSASGKAFLYIVDLSNGTLAQKIAAGTATGNGLSTPVLYDSNGDKITDVVYAGDLQGHLWKFDLTDTTTGSWDVGNGGLPLFTAGSAQAITVQPVVGAHPNGGALIFFGTGRYLTVTDPANNEIQSFYGIWDQVGATTTVTRTDLKKQTIDTETREFGFDLRLSSNGSVDWGTQRGWYIDLLKPPSATRQGERVISKALLQFDRIIFVTAIPPTDPCATGGDGWLMELDALTGSRTGLPSFDLWGPNRRPDRLFDSYDMVMGQTVSGVKSTVGIIKTPSWLSTGDGLAYKEPPGTTGGVMTIGNREPGPAGTPVRRYWMQIQ